MEVKQPEDADGEKRGLVGVGQEAETGQELQRLFRQHFLHFTSSHRACALGQGKSQVVTDVTGNYLHEEARVS